ncbi:SCY1-like protein 2 [Chionoecetes opilio]|uniref:SCY1-like protein 2 n=1 Tax=Chionoecetes opilio TaxID=41210 RepID=A0A8J4XNB4_CHIOP|nr:SCY1-like protein 2 [Chionoecetes opilio]
MESMLNKLRSSVSSAATSAVSNAVQIASQVSNYLPGNPVTREFEATAHVASAGPGLVWKVYKGHKKSTKQDAAIFVFEKRILDRWDKQEREAMLERLRKGVSQLTRLRHPQVLTVQHPLEESRDSLAFATEPVFASLANVLGHTDSAPSPLPPLLRDYKLYDVEIKYGLMQVSEGLAFLHNSVKTVHRNICPENIVLNHQGAWKLFGFDFCVANQAPPDQQPFWPFEEYDPNRQAMCQPSLDYLAPEYALTHTLDPAADLFALGVVTYALFNSGRPIFQNHQDFHTFKRNCCELKNTNTLKLSSIPGGVREEVRLLLHATAQLRPDALQFSKISYFEDVGVKTLNYLDQMFQWDNMQKSQFYKSLPQIIPQLPHRVCVLRVVPSLMRECVNTTMVPFVLPVILLVAEKASREEFVEYVLSHLKPIMKMTDPPQIMLQLMQKMELLLGKTPPEDVRSDVLPLLYRALECDMQQIQELCLSVIPTCAHLVESHAMKNALLPKIKKLCLATGYLSVRVNCLVCVGKILEHLDRWLVMDDIFPFLEQIPSRESPVIMAIVGIFKVALTHKKLGVSKEILATRVLPFLFPLSIENSLTPTQHATVMTLIKEMTEKVEAEHRTKLEQLNSIKDEQKALQMAMPTSLPSSSAPESANTDTPNGTAITPAEVATDMFAGLGLNQQARGEGLLTPQKPAVTSANRTQQSKTDVSSPTAALSLQDKHRMMKEQGQRKQPPLLPSPPAPSSTITKSTQPSFSSSSQTSSLTSSLITSNLSMMSPPGAPQQAGQMGGLGNTGLSYGMSMRPNLPQQPLGTMNSWAGPTQPQAWASSMPQLQPQHQPMAMNLGTFDNLLPSQPRQPSMNQMASTIMSPPMMTPIRPMAMGSAPAPVRPLTSSDINDLLS